MNAEGWIAGATALGMGILALPVIRAAAVRFGLYDPTGPLKIHRQPIPRLGGVAMTLALIVGILVSGLRDSHASMSFLLALVTVWAISLADDLLELSPWIRLAGQFSAALILWQAGWRLPLLEASWLSAAATCLFVAFFVNAFNMLDGSDGLAGGIAQIVALGYIVLLSRSANQLGSVVAWGLLGTCLAFLFFNFPPAKIFMGDSGSTVLGFVIAFLSLDFYRSEPTSVGRLLTPLLFAGLPLADALFAVFRRLRSGASPFAGDRRHFYDLLLQRGWSPRRVALCSYVATGILVIAGWLCGRGNLAVSSFLVSTATASLFAAAGLATPC